VQHKDNRTFGERTADDVAMFAGSWKFIIIFGIIFCCWIAVNCIYIFGRPFDPYPFILLNLVLSFIAAFQAPFIMMSQNRAEKKQDAAYREIFMELKELLEQDITHEQEIKFLEQQIKQDVNLLVQTQNKLLDALHHTITLGQITSQGVEEVLEHLEEDMPKPEA
jgi:uncharacterized membrane protein